MTPHFNAPPNIRQFRIGSARTYMQTLDNGQSYICIGDDGEDFWVNNTHDLSGVGGFLSQCEMPKGRVLVGGLGLGLVALALETKPDVTEVVVVEANPDIIALFKINSWKTSKIKIVQGDILGFTDEQPFDWVVLDHYNRTAELYERVKHDVATIAQNLTTTHFDVFAWEDLFLKSDLSWEDFRTSLRLAPHCEAELEHYLNNWRREGDTPATHAVLARLASVERESVAIINQ